MVPCKYVSTQLQEERRPAVAHSTQDARSLMPPLDRQSLHEAVVNQLVVGEVLALESVALLTAVVGVVVTNLVRIPDTTVVVGPVALADRTAI